MKVALFLMLSVNVVLAIIITKASFPEYVSIFLIGTLVALKYSFIDYANKDLQTKEKFFWMNMSLPILLYIHLYQNIFYEFENKN